MAVSATDVMMSAQVGVAGAVATLGTALTPEHARLLSRLMPLTGGDVHLLAQTLDAPVAGVALPLQPQRGNSQRADGAKLKPGPLPGVMQRLLLPGFVESHSQGGLWRGSNERAPNTPF